MVDIRKTGPQTFEVTVTAETPTQHRVTLSEEYVRSLTGGKGEPEEVIRRSFTFLLEREPNTSILRSFNLSVIGSYFPDYEDWIRSKFS